MGSAGKHARLVAAKLLRLVEGAMWRQRASAPPTPDVERTERTIPTDVRDTPVTIHRPTGGRAEPRPVLVNMHGGGTVLGSRALDEDWCRAIADAVGCVVVNVEYGLAPEHRFPAPIEECYGVVRALATRPAAFDVDPGRIAVGGHSAGAKFATAVALCAAERGDVSLVGQVLDCPPVDEATDPAAKPVGPETTVRPRLAEFFTRCFLGPDGDPTDPLASPLYADESRLRALPPALVFTAEHDLLRREGTQYAERLAAAGVPITHHDAVDCQHMYPILGPNDVAAAARTTTADFLRSVFDRDGSDEGVASADTTDSGPR